MKRYAIVSVYDKTGLIPLVQALVGQGLEILSTGGTAKFLVENGIRVTSVSDYTGHPEILDGRVKSLHPKIHGGILARTSNPADIDELKANDIAAIEFVVVNLYPFTDKVREVVSAKKVDHESLIEDIDIGGPTMIRAAAKNNQFVVPVCDPQDYETIIGELKSGGKVSPSTRRQLAAKVFRTMAAYDGAIARYFSLEERLLEEDGSEKLLAPVQSLTLGQVLPLRYGENPHQAAALYRPVSIGKSTDRPWWKQLQGKEISYNNLLDMYAALDLFLEFRVGSPAEHTAVIIKHTNACGVAVRKTALEAFIAARECDPVSAFGGIIAVSGKLDEPLTHAILEGFVELVLVESVTPGAQELFTKKKNVRLIECDFRRLMELRQAPGVTFRSFCGDYLLQSQDSALASVEAKNVVSGADKFPALKSDLEFAWKVCKHVKSNAIILVKNGQAIGVGAGQMSRVDSARISLERARAHGFDPHGAVAASDAFLPFADTLEILNDGGVVGLVQPGGSIKDEDVIAVAKKREVVMVFTGERHFRH